MKADAPGLSPAPMPADGGSARGPVAEAGKLVAIKGAHGAQGDIYEALRAFVGFAGLPALPPEHILQGWQNRMALPAGVNDYAVISILSVRQHGTPVEIFEAPEPDPASPGTLTVAGVLEVGVQVDFCSEDDTARQRAECLALITRSSLGCDFLGQYGFSPLYADDPRDISFVGDAKQFIRRWMTTLHVCASSGSGLMVDVSYFDRAAVSRIKNVAGQAAAWTLAGGRWRDGRAGGR